MLLFRFCDQKALYDQKSKTDNTGIRLPCRYKHSNRKYRQNHSRNKPMSVPNRFAESHNDHTADSVQDRNADNYNK
jgi:hypothetical protein